MSLPLSTMLAFIAASGPHFELPEGWLRPLPGVYSNRSYDSDEILDNCPMVVPDTTVRGVSVEGGAAMVFVTKIATVADLQRSVARMAELHNRRYMQGGRMTNVPGMEIHGTEVGSMQTGDDRSMPAATATSEDIKRGARLVLHATSARDLVSLRAHVSLRVRWMSRGICPGLASANL